MTSSSGIIITCLSVEKSLNLVDYFVELYVSLIPKHYYCYIMLWCIPICNAVLLIEVVLVKQF